jgi:TPR repeat protein
MNDNPTDAKEQFELGKKYFEGYDIPQDLKKGVYWYTKAAEQGNADAQDRLEDAYYYGHGVQKNLEKANYYCVKSTEQYQAIVGQGNADAQALANAKYKLSIKYREKKWRYNENDHNKEDMFREAKRLLLEAVELGNADAQCSLGHAYNLGNFTYSGIHLIPKNEKEALYWYFKAAENGNRYAQYIIGCHYADGKGASKDLEKAKYWIALSAKQRYKHAEEALAKLNAGATSINKGCYVATCVYGSYDCPEVWTLRRFRDGKLSDSWFGRGFIQLYYAISPKIVELFGNTKWFNRLWKPILNRFVRKLQNKGIDSSPYSDM